MTGFEQKTDQLTRKKIRGSELGKWENFVKFCDFSKISKNLRKLLVLNRKRINLQERKFEDLNWGNGRICFNSTIFLFFQKSRKMTSFEQKKDQFTRKKIRGSELGKWENLLTNCNFAKLFKNLGKCPVLNRKQINLQERKFEVLNWENWRICSNSAIF